LCEGGVCQDLLTEDEKRYVKEGGMILSGKLQESDVENGNKRMYPESVLRREVEKYMSLVKAMRAIGELDHPDDSVINLRNASHMVIDIWWDGPAVMGKVKVLNTPSGKILQALVDDGVKLGISSRGLGSVTDKGGSTIVQDDFQLICFDFVSEPSTPEAFMEHRMHEGKSEGYTKEDRIGRLLSSITRKE